MRLTSPLLCVLRSDYKVLPCWTNTLLCASHTHKFDHRIIVLLASCRSLSYLSCVVSFCFPDIQVPLIKSRISLFSSLLLSAFRKFFLWPLLTMKALRTSVYNLRFSVFVSILHLPFPVSFFLTFICFLVLYLFWIIYFYLFLYIFVFKPCIYLLPYNFQIPSIMCLFSFLPLHYFRHLLISLFSTCLFFLSFQCLFV